jgi:hypothetical protein
VLLQPLRIRRPYRCGLANVERLGLNAFALLVDLNAPYGACALNGTRERFGEVMGWFLTLLLIVFLVPILHGRHLDALEGPWIASEVSRHE